MSPSGMLATLTTIIAIASEADSFVFRPFSWSSSSASLTPSSGLLSSAFPRRFPKDFQKSRSALESSPQATTAASPPSPTIPTPHKLTSSELTKTLLAYSEACTLCTLSTNPSIKNAPFGTHANYVLDDEGRVCMLVGGGSVGSVNIEERDQDGTGSGLVSVFVTGAEPGGGSNASNQHKRQGGAQGIGGGGQGSARCTVTGRIEKIINEEELRGIKIKFGSKMPWSERVMESSKFYFLRLTPLTIYYVGGFGVSSTWIDVPSYMAASSDLVASISLTITGGVNRNNVQDLQRVAREILGLTNVRSVEMVSVDRLGVDLRVACDKPGNVGDMRTDVFRIGFANEVIGVEDAKSEILKIFQEAWEREEGVDWGMTANDGQGIEEDDGTEGLDFPVFKLAGDAL